MFFILAHIYVQNMLSAQFLFFAWLNKVSFQELKQINKIIEKPILIINDKASNLVHSVLVENKKKIKIIRTIISWEVCSVKKWQFSAF